MGNKFEVVVSGVDDFSKVFDKLSVNLDKKAARPIEAIDKRTGVFLGRLNKGFSEASRGAQSLATSMGAAAAPLESLVGIGAGGVGLGLVGGVVAMTTNWMKMGTAVDQTATAIGMSAEKLQLWQAAFKRLNVDSSVATQTLGTLATTMENAAFGRDPQAANAFNILGMSLDRMRNHTLGADEAMWGLVWAFSRIGDAQTRGVLADSLHIPREAITVMMQGVDALKKVMKAAQDAGEILGPDMLKKADEGTAALNAMSGAADGLWKRLAVLSAPAVTYGIQALTKALSPGSGASAWDVLSGSATLRATLGAFNGLTGAGPHPWTHASGVVTNSDGTTTESPRRNSTGRGGLPANGTILYPGGNETDAQAADDIHAWAEGLRPRSSRGAAMKQDVMSAAQVNITVNAPAGHTVTATSNSPAVKVRIAGSMDTMTTP